MVAELAARMPRTARDGDEVVVDLELAVDEVLHAESHGQKGQQGNAHDVVDLGLLGKRGEQEEELPHHDGEEGDEDDGGEEPARRAALEHELEEEDGEGQRLLRLGEEGLLGGTVRTSGFGRVAAPLALMLALLVRHVPLDALARQEVLDGLEGTRGLRVREALVRCRGNVLLVDAATR